MMHYLLDLKTSPPVVVKVVREGEFQSEHVELAQRYADQTKHVLVWATGPDSVTDPSSDDVVHPVGHAPAPVTQQLPMPGVNLAPPTPVVLSTDARNLMLTHPSAPASLAGLWGWLKGEAKVLEGPAEELARQLLQKVLDELFR